MRPHPVTRITDATNSCPIEAVISLLAARCTKLIGYRNTVNGSTLCSACFFSGIDNSDFEFQYRHLLVQGTRFHGLKCRRCKDSITIVTGITLCNYCTAAYFDFMQDNIQNNRSITEYSDPYILRVG